MSIGISQINHHYVSLDQARYATSVFATYLDTSTIKENSRFHKTTLTPDMIFTKEYSYTIDEQVEVITREYNIHYRTCMGTLIYILSTTVDLFLQYTSWKSLDKNINN